MTEANEVEQSVLYILKKRLERPSSLYPALTKLNESRLHQIIQERKNDPHLVQLVKRRNHYTTKVYEYLNDLFGSKLPVRSSNASYRQNIAESRYRGPEAKFITNRYHAELYIRHQILKEFKKVEQIKQLINQQLIQQKKWEKEREKMEEEYNKKIESVNKTIARSMEGFHPSKLQKLKMNNQGSLERIKKDYETEIKNHNTLIISTCKHLSAKTIHKFEELGIPFFCTVDHFKYPTLKEDQEYLLNYIQKVISV